MAEAIKPDLSNPVHFLAFGFGSGLMPKAPGTAGTVVAIIPWLWLGQQSLLTYFILLTLAVFTGIYLCDKTSRDMGVHDHSGIVWDEFCGLWLTMVAIPATRRNAAKGTIWIGRGNSLRRQRYRMRKGMRMARG